MLQARVIIFFVEVSLVTNESRQYPVELNETIIIDDCTNYGTYAT